MGHTHKLIFGKGGIRGMRVAASVADMPHAGKGVRVCHTRASQAPKHTRTHIKENFSAEPGFPQGKRGVYPGVWGEFLVNPRGGDAAPVRVRAGGGVLHLHVDVLTRNVRVANIRAPRHASTHTHKHSHTERHTDTESRERSQTDINGAGDCGGRTGGCLGETHGKQWRGGRVS